MPAKRKPGRPPKAKPAALPPEGDDEDAPIDTSPEAARKLVEETRRSISAMEKLINTPVEQLITKYGLADIRKWFDDQLGLDLGTASPIDIERLCIRGKIGGWKWCLSDMYLASKGREPGKTMVFPEPSKEYPLLDSGVMGLTGHMKHFADMCWDGKIEWKKRVGATVTIHNFFLERGLWDLTNRTQYCEDKTLYNMLCGPASCGKTFVAALRVLILLYCFPREFMAKVCSSSKGSAESRVWAEITKWHEMSCYNNVEAFGGKFRLWQGSNQRLLFVENGEDEKGKKKETAKDVRRGVELVALPRSSIGKGAVKALKGMRQLIKVWVVDEATDVDPSVYDPEIAGNWLEAQFLSQIIYLANPSHDSSGFVEHYTALHEDQYSPESPGWVTRHGGWVTNFNGLDNPNGTWLSRNDPDRKPHEIPCPFPYLINQSAINRLEIRSGGRNTCAFMVQAVGFLPSTELADSVLPWEMIKSSGMPGEPEWCGEGTFPIAGNDPSFGGGDDFCSAFGEIGFGYVKILGQRVRRVLLNIKHIDKIPFLIGKDDEGVTPEELSAKEVIKRCRMDGIFHLSAIASDCTGTSKGFVHLFENMAKNQERFEGTAMHRVGWKEKCSDRPEAPDDGSARKSADSFVDATSELIMSVRNWRHYIKGFRDEDLIDQFGKRKFHVVGQNKFKVQSKDEFRKGVTAKGWAPYGFSPDEMDAVAVLVDLARSCGLGTDKLVHPSQIEEGGRLMTRRRQGGFLYGLPMQTEGWMKMKAG